MSKEYKNCWTINSRSQVSEKVLFSEPVAKEQAMELYLGEDFEDVTDSDIEIVETIMKVY